MPLESHIMHIHWPGPALFDGRAMQYGNRDRSDGAAAD